MSSRSSATPRSNLSEYQSRRASSSATPINPFKPTQPAIKAARTKSPQQPAAGPFSGMRRGEPMAVKAEPFTQAATPLSSGHPSSASSSATPVSPAPLQPRRTVSSATPGGSAKLEEHPRERLQSWLNKYMEEKMAILEQRLSGGDSDEDPEMADMKLALLTKRIADIKAALAAPEQSPTIGTPTAEAPMSRTTGSYPSPLSASTDRGVRSHHPSSDPPAPTKQSPEVVQHGHPVAGPSRRSRLVPASPPPDIDDFDIEEAEGDVTDVEELVPPSSPPLPKSAPAPRTPRRLAPQPSVEAQAEEAMQGVDLDAIWSPSPSPSRSPPPPSEFPGRPARNLVSAPTSTSRASDPTAGVSDAGALTPRVHQIEKQFAWSKEVNQKLRQVFMLPNFRTHQKEAIDETMAGRDVFVLMPTGGGKSLTYQLPAICSQGKTRGVTFVVSPLISLINDQTRHLIKRNIPAIAYTGDLTQADKNIAHAELDRPVPYTKVVYVTPEMLSMGSRIQGILRGLEQRKQLARFVIDEAHCVSGWGHDFRSDYLKLGDLRKDYPGIPIMALTATAPEKVQDDIIRVLGIRGCTVLKQSFNRPNLHYEVRPKQKNVLEKIVLFIKAQTQGVSGIVYCSSREKCEIIAKELRDKDIRAWHYHAGMTKGDRRKIQEGWQEHKFEVIVATIAFGMGIDKPDVRYVIHHSLPRSLEGYYQETGRAGRDGKNSTCILYYTYADSKTVLNLINNDQNLSRPQKERQTDALKEVLRFCHNKTDCRRTQILAFFNESFNAANCNQGCDVCMDRGKNNIVVEDVSADARAVVEMMKAFSSSDRITIINAADCYRGAKGTAGKDLDRNPHHGAGQHWGRGDAERLIQNLVIEGCLKEYIIANRNGWSSAYVTLGPHAQDFVNGRRKLMMDFSQPAALKAKKAAKASAGTATGTTGQARVVPLAQLKQSKQPVSNPLSRKRSRQQIIEEEQAFDDSAWPSDDDYSPGEEPAVSGATVAGTSTKKRKSTGNDGPPDLEQQCFSELQALKSKHGFPLSDELLQMLAAIMPTNMPALRQVEGLPAGVLKDYGTMILGITVKYHEQRSGSKQSRETLTQNQRGAASIQSSRQNVRDRLGGFAYDGNSSAQPTAVRPAASNRNSGATGGGLGRNRATLAKGKAAARPRF